MDTQRWLSVAFTCAIASGYILMPVRDAQVALLGSNNTWKLIATTTVCTLPLSSLARHVLFSKDGGHESTAKSIASFYRLYCATVVVGYLLLPTDSASSTADKLSSVVFYILTETMKLLSVSLLWSFSSDPETFPAGNLVKIFSFFGLCCTLGQTCGSILSWYMLSYDIPVNVLLLIVAILLEVCAQSVSGSVATESVDAKVSPSKPEDGRDSNGSAWMNFRDIVAKDKYLLWICVYTLGYTSTMFMIYIDRMSILKEAELSSQESAAFSAQINLIASVLTCLVQFLMASSSFETLVGVQAGLFALPIITAFGFIGLQVAARSTFIIGTFEVARRVIAFAVSKPCREALYTVVPRDTKYAAKSVIDTFVYRLGGAGGSLLYSALATIRSSPNAAKVETLTQSIVVGLWLLSTTKISSLREEKLKVM